MVDLLPKDLLAGLRRTFGARFDALDQNARLTLAAAASEKVVTHARVREMASLHPFDATRLLQSLVRDGFLEAHNPGRGAVYCLPGAALPKPEEVFGAGAEQSAPRSPNLMVSPPDLAGMRNAEGCLLADQLSLPVIDDLDRLSPQLRASLEVTASEPRAKGKVDRDILIGVILALCEGRFVTLRCLAELVNRKPDTLREQYLSKLVRDRKLSLAFPTTPTHERQAYCATPSLQK